jgi:hypothetical protein
VIWGYGCDVGVVKLLVCIARTEGLGEGGGLEELTGWRTRTMWDGITCSLVPIPYEQQAAQFRSTPPTAG